MDQAPIKKARIGSSPPRNFDIPPAATGPPPPPSRLHREGSFSPLFFSHAPSRHLGRPHSATASEIAATMMLRDRGDPTGGVTTVKLPRASVSAASPALSGSTPGSLSSSIDMSMPSTSTDTRNVPSNLQSVQAMGALELIEHDERPTFLVDLANPANVNKPSINILYINSSLRTCPEICNLVAVDPEGPILDDNFDRFRAWVYATSKSSGDGLYLSLPYHEYGGITWTSTTLRQRFRFVSGNVTPVATRQASPMPLTEEPLPMDAEASAAAPSIPVSPMGDAVDPPDYFGDAAPEPTGGNRASLGAIQSKLDNQSGPVHPDAFTNEVLQVQPNKVLFDWTRVPITDNLAEHIKFAKSVDWAATPLGPMSEWAYDLRAMSNLVMGSPHPAAMYWGPDLVCIYNEAYVELAGGKHPQLMGMRYIDAWSEIWSEIEPIFKSALESGQATMKHDNHLFIRRDGFLEETFFSWAIVPLVGVDGEVVGLYNPAFENTLRRVNDRRMLTLREIGERTASATTVSGFWPQVQKGLEYNDYDVPFSLIYSVKEDTESDVSSLHSGSLIHSPQVILEGSPGVPEGHPAAPAQLDLRSSEEGFAPYMRQCMAGGGAPVVLSESDGTLPTDLLQGVNWRGFGDPCSTIVVFPVVPTTTKEAVTGFIVLGVNPRRPYNDNYKLFIHLLSRQLATSMASVVLFEEEIRRGQRAARLAALDRQELSMQLHLRTQEANESEYRFTRMAEYAPVGMFIADAQGHIDYCNDMWWQISRHSRYDETELAWMNSVREEDRPSLETAWKKLLEERVTISVEFRFKHSQQNGDHTIDTWVLMSAFPEKALDGSLKSIFGCITDISSQKWAEKVQNERREEAVEMKRQQENFIDITSHEMRNPLSAILQCADQIANNISTFTSHKVKEQVEKLLENCLDAANTINLCASHQKRIVDDILTLSKLDSNLLAVTPVDEQPIKVVERALKMFESELLAHDIELEFQVDSSFEKHGVEWAKLDPSRLRQIFINLMTNAIKFTQGRERRIIRVSMSASKDISEITSKGVHYLDRNDIQRTAGMDIDEEEWGKGERINIHCAVEDTGPGLREDELKLLFQRFQQATPRTHVQYGGSGLGLFISRILTEMQGGQIGVTSSKGVGSKFNFYIQSRKSLNPPSGFEPVSAFKIGRKVQAPAAATPQLKDTPASTPARGTTCSEGRPLFDVLIVEDNIVNQKVLQRQLRNCGNNTFVANHGREALDTLQKSRFWAGQEDEGVDISVILMDLEMPVMDGMTCARKIRELEKEGTIVRHIPIIAVTAYARPEQIENAKAAGIDDVISKPFRIPELMPRIEELVGKYENLSVSSES
ncbi:ethylene receptor [Purpureocillium lilacinum]|uniref:Ethylene receptor n=1 Tax=Purpureocillium lilacinum TaxID=33203 RepID=A0A179GZ96_PURLI|nr:ethylene receptor [Purpureocillium lilacinum]OAQ83325.1 ethylene receptor [Purpureocillium lilacinum]